MSDGERPTKAKKRSAKPRDKAHIRPDGETWTSPVSFDAKSLSTVLRDCLDELGYKYGRSQADKFYSQTMVVFPVPKTAYVYRFEVRKPVKVWIDLYDTKPSHAGILPYMDIHGFTPDVIPALKELFDLLIKKLVRPPWVFTIGQKFQHGLLIPEWHYAKKAWRRLGYEAK